MTIEESIEKFGLVPADEALPAIRELLTHEAEMERTGGEREDDLALLCCVQLFSRGYLHDVLLIWEAKQSGFDLACYLDIQLLCGAGLRQTVTYLQNQASPKAASALEYLLKCEASGDFVEWSPATYLDWWRRYFDVA